MSMYYDDDFSIDSLLADIDISDEDHLEHYGTPHEGMIPHSGRWPYGSGEEAYQRAKSFIAEVKDLRKQGLDQKAIADYYNMKSTGELRSRISASRIDIRQAELARAIRLRDEGHSTSEIARRMGKNESSIRSMLEPVNQERVKNLTSLADQLKQGVEEAKYIDIGIGTEHYLGVSRDKLKKTVKMLEEEGYKVRYLQTEQVGTHKPTSIMVLAKEETPWKEINDHKDDIKILNVKTEDGGKTFEPFEEPRAIDISRVGVVYAEDGGTDKDGTAFVRPGVPELSLGNAKYVQARVAVDTNGDGKGERYIKGMVLQAANADDLPDGIDILFYTNKHKSEYPTVESVLKPMKDDPMNPFGATIKTRDDELLLAQRHYDDENGQRQLSALNIVNEEGDWNSWSKTLSSQFLSKQDPQLIKQQLDISYEAKRTEFEEIKGLTNPVVKANLLDSFGDDCDASASHLKAAGLPGQASKVIIPINDIQPDRCYCPDYPNGTRLALVRYPHGSIAEIPVVTVDNNNAEARSLIFNARDAIGIHHTTAEQLSGADFDGDTVVAIPIKNSKIKTSQDIDISSPLRELRKFNPSERYPKYDGMEVMTERAKQMQMGLVSNLITDMTIKGADEDEIARAIKHSMVVIDAVKHELNWKQSYIDNGIAALKEKYQGGEKRGASTLISRASSEVRIPDRKEGQDFVDPVTGAKKRLYIDPETGKKLYTPTGETYKTFKKDENGKIIEGTVKEHARMTKITKMEAVDDAYELASGSGGSTTIVEKLYADYANKLKALGNEARKEYLRTGGIEYNPSAAKRYAEEVKTLKAKVKEAELNAPLERKAQVLANSEIRAKKHANPNMTDEELKKIKGRALDRARTITGAGKKRVQITDSEWDAIQSGAVSTSLLKKVLLNADSDKIKERAMPRESKGISSSRLSYARQLLNQQRYSTIEVAEMLGVSPSTLKRALKEQ